MPMDIQDFKDKVIRKIEEKFEVKEKSGKHIRYEIWYAKQKVAVTYCSHGSGGKEIYDGILSKIRRQLKLETLEQLYGLKNCPFSSEDYYSLLKQNNVISD